MNRSHLVSRAALRGLALVLVLPPAFAAPTPEEYAALPTVHMMSVSPDGKRVAFRTRQEDRDLVLVYSLDEKKVVTGLDAAGIRPTQLYFLDRAHVIVVAANEKFLPGYTGHHRMSSAFALEVDSGEFRQLLTPGIGIIGGQVGLGSILGASADGNRVFMPAFTAPRGVSVPDYSLMSVDLTAGGPPRILERGSYHTVDYFVDAEGKVLAEEIFDDDADEHTILAYHKGKPVRIYRAKTKIPRIAAVGLTADRKSLIIEDDSEDTDRFGDFAMSLADGTVSGPIFKRTDADVEAILTDINRVAYGVVYSGLVPGYEFFDDRITARMQEIQAKFAGNSVWVADASPDLRYLLVRVEGPGASGDYFLYSDDGAVRFLSRSRPGIAPELVNPVAAFDYEARDGATIPALLTLPLGHKDDPLELPAVVLPHGGPESHDWLGFDWLAQIQHGRDHWAVAYWNKVIALEKESRKTVDSISPANFADRFDAPVLLLHGDKDNVVNYDQSRNMERQLRRSGKRVELVTLKGEDHYLSNSATRLECLRAVVDFVNRNIGQRT